MTSPCQDLEPFVDGELNPAATAAFRSHLITCERCQAELGELLRLSTLAERYHEGRPSRTLSLVEREERLDEPAGSPWRRWMWALRWWIGGGLSLAAASLLVLVVWPGSPALDELWQPDTAGRLIEGRSAYARANVYRPMRDVAMGPSSAVALPHSLLGRLPSGEDGVRGLAAAYLVRGQPGLAETALKELEPLEASAEVDSERALAHLVRADAAQGDYEEALRLTDAALEKNPRQPGPALWNRALALRGLGLEMLAANDFDAVAKLGEPGWSGEARRKDAELRKSASSIRDRWYQTLHAGEALVASGTQPPAALVGAPILRLYFYEAIRTRASASEVEALVPLARDLDSIAGGTILEDYVRNVARQDFSVRAPLAKRYLQLVTQPNKADTTGLLADLFRSKEEDILVGALVKLRAPGDEPRERAAFEQRKLTGVDPWFDSLRLQREAKAAQAKGDLLGARQELEEALKVCRQPGFEYRCLDVEIDLIGVLLRLSALDEAYDQANDAWEIARKANEWGKQVQLIEALAQVARLRDDFPLVRAYLEETIELTQQIANKQQERLAHETLALAEVSRLRMDAAREQIDAAIATKLPLTLLGALTLADIARVHPGTGDAAAMEAFRARLSEMGPSRRALATHALGRFTIEVQPDEGRRLLEDAIAQVKAFPTVGDEAFQALTYSYTSLILAAGKEGDFVSAWARFEEEAGAPLPERCMVAAAVDSERTLILVRGAAGVLDGSYDAARTSPLTLRVDGLMPSRLLEGLNGCAEVRVLARAPLYGRAGFLPREIPWSYVLPPAGKAREAGVAEDRGNGFHLVVQKVSLSSRRHLPPTQSWTSDGEDVILSGPAATPAAVLRQIESAAAADIVAHGLVDPSSGEAYLLLAPDSDGRDTLRASQIERAVLRHRPVIILASCGAAKPGPQISAPRSLPAAFLRAGARAVLAATSEIREGEGRAFFDGVRARIDAGNTAARALRDERVSWIAQGKGLNWLDSILLFE